MVEISLDKSNKQGKIAPSCLRISRFFFEDLKNALESDDVDAANNLSPPYPAELTAQILDCFEGRYEMPIAPIVECSGIERIVELLWAFSKSRELASNEVVCQGLKATDIISEVHSLLASIDTTNLPYDHDELSKLCTDVFDGGTFDDADYNSILNKLIAIGQDAIR